MINFRVSQEQADKDFQVKHQCFIRTCKVVNQIGKVVASGLHYLDAIDLARHLNAGNTLESFQFALPRAGFRDRKEAESVADKYKEESVVLS